MVLLIWITQIFAGLDGTQRQEMRSVGKGTQTVECQEVELKQEWQTGTRSDVITNPVM